jgi:hypothetical protein
MKANTDVTTISRRAAILAAAQLITTGAMIVPSRNS